MTRVLITGAGGFVGSHLAASAVRRGDETHVIVRPGSPVERLGEVEDRLTIHRIDLCDSAEIKHCLRETAPDFIFHLAASPRRPFLPDLHDATDYVRQDLDSLISLLSAAAILPRPPRRMVRTGSLAEYGLAPLPYREYLREEPTTAYGAGLVAQTQFIGALQPRLGFPVITARLSLVYGPKQSTAFFLPWLITRCLAGQPSTIQRPDDLRDILYIDDVLAALWELTTAELPGGMIINISTGSAPTMRELAELVVRISDVAPDLIEFGNGPISGVADFRGDITRARQLLKWRPTIPLESGLPRTIDWFRRHFVQETDDEEPLLSRQAH